jgi:FkbM family methyltransferase
LRRTLNRAASRAGAGKDGLAEVAVAAGSLQGARLRLDLQLEKDYWLGTYEPELQAAIQAFARPGMVAYDVGANVGYVTLMLARAVGEGGFVHAFEALPANLERLREHVRLNGFHEWVEIHAGAVVERPTPVTFLLGTSPGTGKALGSAGRQGAGSNSIQVEGIELDSFVYRQGHAPPVLLKMDIEGGEGPALRGMRRVLAEARPVILLEIHGPECAAEAWATLDAHGYALHGMQPGSPRLPGPEALPWKAYVVALPGQTV